MKRRLFKKAFRDLFKDKRKAIVALSAIVIGMIAFGTLLFSYEIITNELIITYSSTNPSSASISVDCIDNQLIELTEAFTEIEEYEVKTQYQMRGQKENGEWTTVELFASDDYTAQGINKVFYIDGNENPGQDEMLIERDAINVAGKSIGDTIFLTMPDGSEKELTITGVINDLSVHPATMHNTIYVYVSMETLKAMGLFPNRIDYKISGNPYDRENILTVSNEYLRMLEQNGYQIKGLSVENIPGVSMHLEEYKTALFLLRTFAFVAFLFGCMIMSSLITSILTGQVRQIGILKTFGTKTGSITLSYLVALFSFVGFAGASSLLLSKLLANIVSTILLRISNMSLTHTQINPVLYVVFLLLCFTVPLLIAFLAIRRATKITIKEAINDSVMESVNAKVSGVHKKQYGIIAWLPRPVMFTMRNALRRKARFILNVATLALSGACFITVFVSMLSVSTTLKDNLNTFGYDYRFITNSAGDTEVGEVLQANKEIGAYECWGYTSGKILHEDGQIGNSYPVFAIPQNSKLVNPDLLEGNWLQGEEADGIVVGHEFLKNNPDVSIGDTITLDIAETQLKLRIAGEIKDFSGSNIYMCKEYYMENVPAESRRDIVQVQLDSNRRGRSKAKFIQRIEESLLEKGISILQSETKANAIKILNSHYMATFQTFLIVIFMILVVSAFGLSSTTNIQTLERRKEIGIMKAMGADKKQVVQIITSESVFTGLCGWGLSAVLAIGGIMIGLIYFSAVTLKAPIVLNIGSVFAGYAIWLLLILLIGKKASRRAAVFAANMTVKNSLE